MRQGPVLMHEEKMLAVMILEDRIGQLLDQDASDTYWRGFIVENRTSGEISLRHRFRYRDGTDSWYAVELNADNQAKSRAERVDHLQSGMERALTTMIRERHAQKREPPIGIVQTRYVPDDNGDLMATVRWLEEQDLIKPPRCEPKEANG